MPETSRNTRKIDSEAMYLKLKLESRRVSFFNQIIDFWNNSLSNISNRLEIS